MGEARDRRCEKQRGAGEYPREPDAGFIILILRRQAERRPSTDVQYISTSTTPTPTTCLVTLSGPTTAEYPATPPYQG